MHNWDKSKGLCAACLILAHNFMTKAQAQKWYCLALEIRQMWHEIQCDPTKTTTSWHSPPTENTKHYAPYSSLLKLPYITIKGIVYLCLMQRNKKWNVECPWSQLPPVHKQWPLGLKGKSGLLAETLKPFLSNVFILLLEPGRDFRKSWGPMKVTNLVPRCSF